jgi:hypothetical protein
MAAIHREWGTHATCTCYAKDGRRCCSWLLHASKTRMPFCHDNSVILGQGFQGVGPGDQAAGLITDSRRCNCNCSALPTLTRSKEPPAMPQPCMQLRCCLPAGISGLAPQPPTLPLLPLACCSLNALLGQPASVCLFLPFLSSSSGARLLERLASVGKISRPAAPLPSLPSSGSQVRQEMRRGAPPPLPPRHSTVSKAATPPSVTWWWQGRPAAEGRRDPPSQPSCFALLTPQPAALPPQAAHHDLHFEPRQQEVRSRGLPRPLALDFPLHFSLMDWAP